MTILLTVSCQGVTLLEKYITPTMVNPWVEFAQANGLAINLRRL